MKDNAINNTNVRSKIPEYDFLRIIVTLLVIVGHSTFYCITTPYGGCDYLAYTKSSLSFFYKFVNAISVAIYLFHMPLYMALSGALYKLKISRRGGYSSYKSLISDKAQKLLFPFVVVTILYSVPLKYISGYYKTSDNVIYDIIVGQIFIQGNTHLWFLPTLFVIFILVYFINKYIHADHKLILIVLFAASFISLIIPIVIVKQVLYYAFWFYVGFCFENSRHIVNKKVEDHPYLLMLYVAIFVFAAIALKLVPSKPGADMFDIIERMLNYFCAISGCYVVYLLSYIISDTKIKETKVFAVIRNNTLGLYLYSDSWNYVILCVSTVYFGSAVFVNNIGSALLYFARIIITFIIALIISLLLKKLKIKYIC